MIRSYRGLFQHWEIAIVVKLVREFQQRWRSLAREPAEDLLQDCLIHWLAVRRTADPTRRITRNAFMARVVRNKLMDMLRERESEKRKANYDAVSLDDPTNGFADRDDPWDRWDESVEQYRNDEDDIAQQQVRLDLAAAIQRLTPIQQRLCMLLIYHDLTVMEVSGRLRMSPEAIDGELNHIRKLFAEFGLQDYLKR